MTAGSLLACAWAAVVIDGARRAAAAARMRPDRYRTLLRAAARRDGVRVTAPGVTGLGVTGPGLTGQGLTGQGEAAQGGAGPAGALRGAAARVGEPLLARVGVLRPVGAELVGVGVVAAVAGALAFGIVGVLGAIVAVAAAARRSARRRAVAERGESLELAVFVDLIALTVRSGLPLGAAIERASLTFADSSVGSLGRLLRSGLGADAALERWGAGASNDRAALARLLRGALRAGGATAERLEARAERMRHRRRHELLTEARRLPVRLLAPLVCCTLPAFVALTVVPLLVVSLRSLGPLM
ncbi:MAG: hypothetical protein GX868_02645 [Actinobacteria bacterium]|nr:hypothetical protein [Actinomycetota bacterium]